MAARRRHSPPRHAPSRNERPVRARLHPQGAGGAAGEHLRRPTCLARTQYVPKDAQLRHRTVPPRRGRRDCLSGSAARRRAASRISRPRRLLSTSPSWRGTSGAVAQFFASGPVACGPTSKRTRRRKLPSDSSRPALHRSDVRNGFGGRGGRGILRRCARCQRAGRSRRMERLAELARRTDVTVAVDSVKGLEELDAAATRAGTRIGVLVDVNVGQNRCSVAPGDAAMRLARQVLSAKATRFRGVMGYEGHVVGIPDRTVGTAARRAMTDLVATARALHDAGLPCEVVSGGVPGTYDITGRIEGITEIQAGSAMC